MIEKIISTLESYSIEATIGVIVLSVLIPTLIAAMTPRKVPTTR